MPNIQSAIKRVKVSEKKNLRNRMIKSGVKTAVKKYETALTASCDCGEDKCLKDNKCVSNPNRLFHWLFGLKKIEKQTHEL